MTKWAQTEVPSLVSVLRTYVVLAAHCQCNSLYNATIYGAPALVDQPIPVLYAQIGYFRSLRVLSQKSFEKLDIIFCITQAHRHGAGVWAGLTSVTPLPRWAPGTNREGHEAGNVAAAT